LPRRRSRPRGARAPACSAPTCSAPAVGCHRAGRPVIAAFLRVAGPVPDVALRILMAVAGFLRLVPGIAVLRLADLRPQGARPLLQGLQLRRVAALRLERSDLDLELL